MVGVLRTDRRAGPEERARARVIELNPEGSGGIFLGGVNRCFPERWSDSVYRWYLRRELAGRAPDLLVVRDPDGVVAGLGLNYRSALLASGERVEVGIVTAAWTLPAARGRGHFLALLSRCVEIATGRGCSLVMAFATQENCSSRAMRHCGAAMFPTSYLVSTSREGPLIAADDTENPTAVDPAEIEGWLPRRAEEGATRFVYANAEDWRSQFLRRPYPIEALRAGETKAIVERVGDMDRLVLLLGPPSARHRALSALAARARRAGRGFFAFSTEPSDSGLAEKGWVCRPGYLAALSARPFDLGTWEVQPGDRM